MYDPSITQPMRDELTAIGVSELRTPDEVDAVLRDSAGTTLLIVNSVCGCAAGMARPGLRSALQAGRPDRVVSVFAGVDGDATRRARGYFAALPPSSPFFALFKDGRLVHHIPRNRIEGRDAQSLSSDLIAAIASAKVASTSPDSEAVAAPALHLPGHQG
ncbi:MAG: BrxA/BrxB family bacilliredoxin [Thermoanaerobaculia bacterium]